jgi:hypothetical protein
MRCGCLSNHQLFPQLMQFSSTFHPALPSVVHLEAAPRLPWVLHPQQYQQHCLAMIAQLSSQGSIGEVTSIATGANGTKTNLTNATIHHVIVHSTEWMLDLSIIENTTSLFGNQHHGRRGRNIAQLACKVPKTLCT